MVDWQAVAERIHGLVHVPDERFVQDESGASTGELVTLRHRLEQGSFAARAHLLSSVVRLYGLDPSWVIKGEFDPSTHRVVLEGGAEEARRIVERLIAERGEADAGAERGRDADNSSADSLHR